MKAIIAGNTIIQDQISRLKGTKRTKSFSRMLLESNELNDPNQHGFLKGRSTLTQLIDVSHSWYLASNQHVPLHCVSFDFSSAFDVCDHQVLLTKMTRLGIGDRLTRWVQSYLQHRSFRVKVSNSLSAPALAPSGVPQGSRLGPQLFTIFCNDLKNLLNHDRVQYHLYADDLKILTQVSSPNDRDQLQATIHKIAGWASENKMTISIPKCAVIKTVPCEATYFIDDHQIPVVSSFRDLGVNFDADLKFRSHIVNVARSAGRVSNLIMRTFTLTEPSAYLSLYRSLVVPKFLYCSPVWSPAYQKDWALLNRVQSTFARRVARRCSLSRHDIELEPLDVLLSQADNHLVINLAARDKLCDHISLEPNRLRTGLSARPPETARTFLVNNSFAWRTCRHIQENDILRTKLIPLLNKRDLN